MNTLQDFMGTVDFWQVLSSFIFLIAIIDPLPTKGFQDY